MGRVGTGSERDRQRGVFTAGNEGEGPDAARTGNKGRRGPVVVVGDHAAGAVVETHDRISERAGHPKLREGRAHAADEERSIRGAGDDETTDEHSVGGREAAAAGGVGEA